jgi:hypothetical protein
VRTLSALRETDPRLKRLLPQNRSVLAGSPCRRAAVADEPEDERHPCRARLAKASGVSRQIRGTAAKTSPALAKVDVWRGKHPGCLLPACGRLAQKGCKEAYCATAGVSQASLIVDSGGNASWKIGRQIALSDAQLSGQDDRARRLVVAELEHGAQGTSSVTVQIHPSLLGVELPSTALSLQGGPDGPTCSGTTSRVSMTALITTLGVRMPSFLAGGIRLAALPFVGSGGRQAAGR